MKSKCLIFLPQDKENTGEVVCRGFSMGVIIVLLFTLAYFCDLYLRNERKKTKNPCNSNILIDLGVNFGFPYREATLDCLPYIFLPQGVSELQAVKI